MAKQTDARWSLDELREIVAAGMSVTEARMLQDEGYPAAEVLELAKLQAQSRTAQAAETQTATAKAMQKAMKPENQTHPGISALSYPEGDVAKPRPALPFEFYWNAYPVHKFPETQHWRELELMAQVKPGEYTVMRRDFTPMTVTVKGDHDATGKLTKVEVEFPISRAERALVPPQVVLLYQLVHPDNPRKRFVEAMQHYLLMQVGEETTAAVN